jgi:TolB-like protein/DNA-binding winged helix-turn-helix (wHTH) protein/Tfp pilus assembly protein PilF
VLEPNPYSVYTFGPFRADFVSCEVQKHGIRLHVQNQPVRALQMLIERAGRLVTRQELIDRLWPGQTAGESDDSLNSTLKKLRESLGDDPGKPLYIETVPRRGYRFIAPVQVETPKTAPGLPKSTAAFDRKPESSAIARSTGRLRLGLAALVVLGLVLGVLVSQYLKYAAADSQTRSIAVLPFEDLSGDTKQDYFAEGLTDALTTDLAELGNLKVISRASASHYKTNAQPLRQIHDELGVDAVVEGTLAHSGNRIRVNARLVSTIDDRNLWAQSFERDAGDILVLEDDVARSVAQRVEVALTPQQRVPLNDGRPVNVQAYQALLTGMHALNTHRTNNDLRKSLEQFDEALSLDPKFAEAYAGKAIVYNLLGDYDAIAGSEAGPKAEEAARQALALNSSLAYAHSALAFALWKYDWNWKDAESEFQKSLELNPNNAHTHHVYGIFLACKGDFNGADEHIRKARELDPLSMIIRTNASWIRYFQRDFPKAEVGFLDVLKVDPEFLPARLKLWIAYAEEGKTQQAEAELENVMRLYGQDKLLQSVQKKKPEERYEAALRGSVDANILTAYERARYLALLGRKREAIEALRSAAAEQSAWIIYIKIEPVFEAMRNMPEFVELAKRANFPEPTSPGN